MSTPPGPPAPPGRRMPPRPNPQRTSMPSGGGRPTGMKPKTGLAIASLVLGVLGLFTAGLLLVGATVGIVLGIVALTKVSKSPGEYGGKGMAIAGIVLNAMGFVMIPFLGIIAAIAIPSLLRARVSANEAQAIGTVRTVVSSQVTYASSNGGYYDSMECLQQPQACIPGYPAEAPMFIQADMPLPGYVSEFHLGPPVSPMPPNVSPTSSESFVFLVMPEEYGVSGVRAFCTDPSGMVCAFDGETTPYVEGTCPVGCEPLN